MPISPALNSRSKVILEGMLTVAKNAKKAYQELEETYDIDWHMSFYADDNPVSLLAMAQIRSTRDRIDPLQDIEGEALTAFTNYSVELSKLRVEEDECGFEETLYRAQREYERLAGDFTLFKK